MLKLTRNVGEKIIINDDIKIHILACSDTGLIRIGIDAPKSISVNREEIYKKLKQESGKFKQ